MAVASRPRLLDDLDLLEVTSRYSAVRKVSYPVDPLRRLQGEAPQPLSAGDASSQLGRVAALLEWAYGYRAQPVPGRGRPTRRSPSAGALYPTECFVVSRAEGAWALYYYDYRHHLYYRLARPGIDDLARWTKAGPRDTVVVLASVLWRSAQRYGARCYLYCLLDAGNVASNLATVAREHEIEVETTHRSLTLDHQRQIGLREGEGALASLIVRDDGARPIEPPAAPTQLPPGESALAPPLLSPVLSRVTRFHRRTLLPQQLRVSLADGRASSEFAQLAERRHSAPSFTREPLDDEVVEAMTERCAATLESHADGGGPLLRCSVVSLRSAHSPPRSYRVGDDGSAGETVREFSGVDEAATRLARACQSQTIVYDCSFALVMSVDLAELARDGHHGFRAVALAAGAACSDLYREATRLGVGTTSVGGFGAQLVGEVVGTTACWPVVIQAFGVERLEATKVDAAVLAAR